MSAVLEVVMDSGKIETFDLPGTKTVRSNRGDGAEYDLVSDSPITPEAIDFEAYQDCVVKEIRVAFTFEGDVHRCPLKCIDASLPLEMRAEDTFRILIPNPILVIY